MKVTPELLCTDIEASKEFYIDVLGFELKYERREERFAYFTREGLDLMCEELAGPGRRWITGEMKVPFGRGINLQWEVGDVAGLYESVRRIYPECIYLGIEIKTYQCGQVVVEQTQFVVQDPDGYLFRFCD